MKLKKYHLGFKEEIISEHHLEAFILNEWGSVFPFPHFATRKRISQYSIVDLLGKDDITFYVIELKYRPSRKKDLRQLNRYVKDMKKNYDYIGHNISSFLIDYDHSSQRIGIYAI